MEPTLIQPLIPKQIMGIKTQTFSYTPTCLITCQSPGWRHVWLNYATEYYLKHCYNHWTSTHTTHILFLSLSLLRQTDRQTERQRERQTETKTHRETNRGRHRLTDRDRNRERQRQRETAQKQRQKQGETDRQRQTETETDKDTETDRQRQTETERRHHGGLQPFVPHWRLLYLKKKKKKKKKKYFL